MEKHRVAVVIFAEVEGVDYKDAGRVLELSVMRLLAEHGDRESNPGWISLTREHKPTNTSRQSVVRAVVALRDAVGSDPWVELVPTVKAFFERVPGVREDLAVHPDGGD